MGAFEYIVIFVLSWWLILLMVLPYKGQVKPQSQPEHYHGAPERTLLKPKIYVTTALAILMTLVVSYLINQGIMTTWLPYRF